MADNNILPFPKRCRRPRPRPRPRMTDTTQFPDISGSSLCSTSRGMALELTLVGVGQVRVTVRELVSALRFTRAVYRQTGVEIPPMKDRVWRRGDWLYAHLSACKERRSN